jgi:hypothetical protein
MEGRCLIANELGEAEGKAKVIGVQAADIGLGGSGRTRI